MPIFTKQTKNITFSLLASSFALSITSQAANYYDVIDLGVFEEGGLNDVSAFSINNNDIVVGQAAKQELIINPDDPDDSRIATFFHGFSYSLSEPSLVDLGAIDNSEVLVEVTNIEESVPVSKFINVGVPFTSSSAFSINEDNTIVGVSTRTFGTVELSTTTDSDNNEIPVETATSNVVERAFFIQSGDTLIQEIPDFVPESPSNMRALSLNDGVVVGFGKFNDPNDEFEVSFDRGFFYEINGSQPNMVGTLNNDPASSVSLRAINDGNFAVGLSEKYLVDDSGNLIINSRDGSLVIESRSVIGVDASNPDIIEEFEIFGGTRQQAWDVNNNNVIVGSARRSNSTVLVAFSYDINNGTATELGVLNDNFPESSAFGINNEGQIVGNSRFQNSINAGIPDVYHAFLYEDNTMKDLNLLIDCDTGWRLDEARSINNSGKIIGTGILNGQRHAFLLTEKDGGGTAPNCEVEEEDNGGAIPAFGLLGLFFVSWFRRKSNL